MKLDYPLLLDDKLAIKNSLFILRKVVLSAGSATIQHPAISPSSLGFISRKTAGGTTGDLRIECTAGKATITSASSTDTSEVYVLIII